MNKITKQEPYSSDSVEEKKNTIEQEKAVAQYNLGLNYYNGKGVEKDYKKAMEWFKISAEQGNADAQYHLGLMYTGSLGVKRDYKQAVNWYYKAAIQGHSKAQYCLGTMYATGQGIKRNKQQTIYWLTKSKEQRDKVKDVHTVFKYSKGGIVEECIPNKVITIESLQEDAEKGKTNDLVNLATAYFHGFYTRKDYMKALKWYRKAADQGDEFAQERADFIQDIVDDLL